MTKFYNLLGVTSQNWIFKKIVPKSLSKRLTCFPHPYSTNQRSEEKVSMALGSSAAFSQLVVGKKNRKTVLFVTV